MSIEMVRRRQSGLTLIELVIFIVVVGIGVAGVLSVLNLTVSRSADPMVQGQALAIARSLMEEVTRKQFTICDPDDANANTATSPGVVPAVVCATTPENAGPETGETRYSLTLPFDNVNDYQGFSMAGIQDITGAAVGGLAGYNASVGVVQESLGGITAAESLRVTVTVTGPGGASVVLDSYRTRYQPRT